MSNSYWKDREALTQSKLTEKNIKQTEAQLAKYYSRSMQRVINDFERTYEKLLATVADGRQITPADLYKLDTYWQMQGQLKRELQKLGDKQVDLLSKKFVDEYSEIYRALALKDNLYFREIDKDNALQMINQIWCADGKSWSQRIWGNVDKLQQTLNDGLIECVVTGKKTTELKNILQERFSVGYNNSDSIVRTEMAHIQTQSAQQRYKDTGIERYEVWADKDERRCEYCGKLHKTTYPVGTTPPIPAHPRCRCTIIPVVEQLTSLDKDDIMIGRSVGAASKNYPVKAPDSKQHYKFAEGTSITKIKIIMGNGTNKPLSNKYKIALKCNIDNPDAIQKLRGEGFVMVEGKKRRTELHWYEDDTGERYEFKVKRFLDES